MLSGELCLGSLGGRLGGGLGGRGMLMAGAEWTRVWASGALACFTLTLEAWECRLISIRDAFATGILIGASSSAHFPQADRL